MDKAPPLVHLDAQQDHKKLVAAFRRVGAKSAEELLRDVLQFSECNLKKLSPRQRELFGWELRVIGLGRGGDFKVGQMPDLVDLQAQIVEGIRQYFGPLGEWRLREVARPLRLLRVDWIPGKKPRPKVGWAGSEEDQIIAGIWDLIVSVGDRLRACRLCHRFFVARKRQEYCTEPQNCSQLQRNEWKKRGTSRKQEDERARSDSANGPTRA